MSIIYLVRHGQASFGSDNYDKLSSLGELQASITGEYFSEIGVQFDAAFCGDLDRQKATAQLVLEKQYEETMPVIDPRFNEIKNDEQIEKILPLITPERPDIARIVDRGFSESKDYQKIIGEQTQK